MSTSLKDIFRADLDGQVKAAELALDYVDEINRLLEKDDDPILKRCKERLLLVSDRLSENVKMTALLAAFWIENS
jgi:hypothetical protein